MSTLHVLLVDDHEVVRMGLRMVLEGVADIAIVGEASTGEEAIAACERLGPDAVIMDIRMPGSMSGIDACREITARWPATQVIMLTSYPDDDLIGDAIHAGAVGYVLKKVGTTELIRALEAARQGAASLDPAVTRRVLSMVRDGSQPANPFRELTERELMVLRLLAQGKTNREIAEVLVLSEKTVRNHVSTILDKLGVANRVEAATYAVQHRLSDTLEDKNL
jgi:DNA-binding NarL/FixJ family response regulator